MDPNSKPESKFPSFNQLINLTSCRISKEKVAKMKIENRNRKAGRKRPSINQLRIRRSLCKAQSFKRFSTLGEIGEREDQSYNSNRVINLHTMKSGTSSSKTRKSKSSARSRSTQNLALRKVFSRFETPRKRRLAPMKV